MNRAMYFTKDGVGHFAEDESYQPERPNGVGATSIVTPGNPSDIGVTVDVSGNPLFVPTSEEGNQGQVGDCYLLSPFNSLAKLDWFRRLLVVRNGLSVDVTFRRNLSAPVVVRTDNLIGSAYSRPDPVTRACAACLLEKAFAYFRTKSNTYASLDFGWPGNVYSDFGCANIIRYATDGDLVALVRKALASLMGVCVCTRATVPTGVPVIGAHCYSVVEFYVDSSGVIQWKLRNPWGFDGAGADADPNDGVVTLSHGQFTSVVSGVSIQTSFPVVPPSPTPPTPPTPLIPGDANGDGKVDFADYVIFNAHYGKAGGWADGDFNGDGIVDFKDFLILSQNFGKHS